MSIERSFVDRHTPGPWEVRSRHESRGEHTTVSRYVAIPGYDYIEASRITDPTPEQDEMARANVRLLAAAPELLGALRMAIRELPDRCEYTHEAHEMARRVIAKVEGQQP